MSNDEMQKMYEYRIKRRRAIVEDDEFEERPFGHVQANQGQV